MEPSFESAHLRKHNSLFLVATGARAYLPDVVLNTATFLGEGAIPLGIFALGATLGTLDIDLRRYLKPGILVLLQKLFIMPLVVLGAMALTWMLGSATRIAVRS